MLKGLAFLFIKNRKRSEWMIVRLATKKDLNELRTIYYESRLEHFSWIDNSQASLIDYDQATAEEFVLLVEDVNEIIGFLSVYEPENFIHLLFVKPGHEGKGIGSRLVETLLRERKDIFSLKCLSQNRSACQFYKKHGFSVVSEEDDEHDGPYYVMSNAH